MQNYDIDDNINEPIDDSIWKANFDYCQHSIKLLDKIKLLNKQSSIKVNIIQVKKAIYYARKYHGTQKRQSGEPYYSHPLEVAYLMTDYLFRTDIIVTAILHDTLEDTDLTFKMIVQIFGARIAEQVMDLTRIKADGIKITSATMVQELWLQKKYDILMVKMFDRLHNMLTISAKSPEKMKKIIEETTSTFIILATYLELPNIKDLLSELCIQNYQIDNHLAGVTSESFKEPKKFSFFQRASLLPLIYQNKLKQICNLSKLVS